MRIIILGASGQLGREIYKELKKHTSIEVTGTSRSGDNWYMQFDPFKDDWSLLGKSDVLINCVGQIQESRDFPFEKVHGGLTQVILKHRALLGDPRIIQLSVLGADKESPVSFLSTKGIADEILLQFPDTLVLRPSIVCSHRTMMVKKMQMVRSLSGITAGFAIVPRGFTNYRIQPIMVEDLAAIVARLCFEKEIPQILNLTGPHPVSYREIMEWLFEAAGKKLRMIQVPKRIADVVVKNIIDPVFPSLISKGQYHLLFHDNLGDPSEGEKYLGRKLTSTVDFWKKEFK